MNTQIIAIANQKGGVGKTTTCANLGIGLAQAGKKVLLIDGDPQGSLTISLGNPQPDKLPFTLSDAMGKILMDQPIRPGEGILHHAEGVDLMPADIQLSGMEVSLVNAMSRETVLRQYLDTLKGQYSHILIDCQPSLGMPSAEGFKDISFLFQQLGDPTRLRILWLLCHCEECVCNLAAAVDMSAPAVSHHLRILKKSGIISSRRDGKEVYYSLSDTPQAKLLHHAIDALFEISCPTEQ